MAHLSNDPLAQVTDNLYFRTVAKREHTEGIPHITTRYNGNGLYLLPILFPDWK